MSVTRAPGSRACSATIARNSALWARRRSATISIRWLAWQTVAATVQPHPCPRPCPRELGRHQTAKAAVAAGIAHFRGDKGSGAKDSAMSPPRPPPEPQPPSGPVGYPEPDVLAVPSDGDGWIAVGQLTGRARRNQTIRAHFEAGATTRRAPPGARKRRLRGARCHA